MNGDNQHGGLECIISANGVDGGCHETAVEWAKGVGLGQPWYPMCGSHAASYSTRVPITDPIPEDPDHIPVIFCHHCRSNGEIPGNGRGSYREFRGAKDIRKHMDEAGLWFGKEEPYRYTEEDLDNAAEGLQRLLQSFNAS